MPGMRGSEIRVSRAFVAALNQKLVGHYNDYGLRGNAKALHRFYHWAIACAFKWLNRRGGKRRSFTSAVTEKLATLSTLEYLEARAEKGSRAKFESALSQVPEVEPDETER